MQISHALKMVNYLLKLETKDHAVQKATIVQDYSSCLELIAAMK